MKRTPVLAEADDAKRGASTLKKKCGYTLFHQVAREDMHRKFGGKDALFRDMVEKHSEDDISFNQGPVILTTIAKMWTDANPTVKEFFNHAAQIHMAWMEGQLDDQPEAKKPKKGIEPVPESTANSESVKEDDTPIRRLKQVGGGKRRKESLTTGSPAAAAVADTEAQGKSTTRTPKGKQVARKPTPDQASRDEVSDGNSSAPGKAAASSKRTGPGAASFTSKTTAARKGSASSAAAAAASAAPSAEAKQPAAAAAAAVFSAPEAKGGGDGKETGKQSRRGRDGGGREKSASSIVPGRSIGPAGKSAAAAATSAPEAKGLEGNETGKQSRRWGGETTATRTVPRQSLGSAGKSRDKKAGATGTAAGGGGTTAADKPKPKETPKASSSTTGRGKGKEPPGPPKSAGKSKAAKESAGGNSSSSNRKGGGVGKGKVVPAHSAGGDASDKEVFGLPRGEKHAIDVLWEVEVQKSGQKAEQTEEWFTTTVDLVKPLGTDAAGRPRFRINYARRGNLPASKSVVVLLSSNQLRDDLQDDYEDPMLWRKWGCNVAPGPGSASPAGPSSAGTEGGGADQEEEWADDFGMRSSRRR